MQNLMILMKQNEKRVIKAIALLGVICIMLCLMMVPTFAEGLGTQLTDTANNIENEFTLAFSVVASAIIIVGAFAYAVGGKKIGMTMIIGATAGFIIYLLMENGMLNWIQSWFQKK